MARGHSRTKGGSDAPQDFQTGAWVPFKHLLRRCAVFIALKHGQQPQPGSNQHRLTPENLGITGNEGLKRLFDRCHILIFVLAGWFVQTAHAGEIVTPAFFAITGNGEGGRSTPTGGVEMNLRQVWTEIFQKLAGRLLLFLVISPHARAQATPAERVSDKIARATPTPKPPSPIPQTIFAIKEQSISESFLPYGRMLRCELVNTVDSTNIDTPIIGLVIENAWNDGRLIIPAGTEVHGAAQTSAVRERIGSNRQWFLVFQDGRELPVSGTVLDCAPDPEPDTWLESDGSAGLRGYFVKSDKYAEAKAILASMISAGAGAFPQTTTLPSPLGGATQINSGGMRTPSPPGSRQAANSTRSVSWNSSTRTRTTSEFPPAPPFTSTSQTVDLAKATAGLSASLQPSSDPNKP